MTIAEAREARERAEALRQRAEVVLADDAVAEPYRSLWSDAHLEAVMALAQIRRVLEGRAV